MVSKLMIGSWVNHKGKPVQLTVNALLAIENGSQHYSPIELTPEILEKCFEGLEEVAVCNGMLGYDHKGRIYIYVEKGDECWTELDLDHIKHLHELQLLTTAIGADINIEL